MEEKLQGLITELEIEFMCDPLSPEPAQEESTIPKLLIGQFKHDPIEDDPSIKPLLIAASEEARAELAAAGKNIGFGAARSIWRVKQRILKEKYQIEWKSPGEMNPGCDFD